MTDSNESIMREPTYGEKAVGLKFNPGNRLDVQALKEKAAEFIDMCDRIRTCADDPEVKRMASVAITEAQTAQMWAVKAVTWVY